MVCFVRKNIDGQNLDFESVYSFLFFSYWCDPWQTSTTLSFFFSFFLSRSAVLHPVKHPQMRSLPSPTGTLSNFLHFNFLFGGFGRHSWVFFFQEHPEFLHGFDSNRLLQSSSYHS